MNGARCKHIQTFVCRLDDKGADLAGDRHPTPVPLCEADGCIELATAEYESVDDDGCTYYSYRCDAHPVTDPEYVRLEVIRG